MNLGLIRTLLKWSKISKFALILSLFCVIVFVQLFCNTCQIMSHSLCNLKLVTFCQTDIFCHNSLCFISLDMFGQISSYVTLVTIILVTFYHNCHICHTYHIFNNCHILSNLNHTCHILSHI